MPYSTGDIAAKLPYLRRYARALTGSQATGDEYVRTCLEVIARDRHQIGETVDLQTELFRLFHKVYASTDPKLSHARPAGGEPALRTVMALPPIERQVLLLSALERYSFGDVAYILDVPEDTVRDLFNRAQESMMSLAAARVLIIEDEPEVQAVLADMLREAGYDVVVAKDGTEGLERVEHEAMDIVLSDISMPGLSGWDVAARLRARFPTVPLGFVTGWGDQLDPERLARMGVSFVIAKPFQTLDVLRHVAQALAALPPR
jgi:CheY-like chemotaxis protein/DNA-directed RNA polymerase specialized sigma24 family protein